MGNCAYLQVMPTTAPRKLLSVGLVFETILVMAFTLAVLVAVLTGPSRPIVMEDQPATPKVMESWEPVPTTQEITP